MEKQILNEIVRIRQMMGLGSVLSEGPESYCPFCVEFFSQISKILDQAAKIGDDANVTKQLEDIRSKIDSSGLNLNQKETLKKILDDVTLEYKNTKSITKLQDEIKLKIKNEAFSDIVQPNVVVKNIVDPDIIIKDINFATELFDSGFKHKTYKSNIEANLDTVIEFANKNKKSDVSLKDATIAELDSFIREKYIGDGLDATLINNLMPKWKEWIEGLDKIKSMDLGKIERSIPYKGTDTLDVKYSNKFFEIIKKTGDDLTESELAFKKLVEGWKAGKDITDVDFEAALKKIDEDSVKPKPEDEVIDNNVTQSDDIVDPVPETNNFFDVFANESLIDSEFISEFHRFRMLAGNSDNVFYKKCVKNLEDGKKLTSADILKLNDEIFSKFPKVKDRLLNPKKTKFNIWQTFYWSTVEPIVREYRALWRQGDTKFEKMARESVNESGEQIYKEGANFTFYADEFLKKLEGAITFSENITPAQLKQLKDSFVRLSANNSDTYRIYYDKLWSDLDEYLNNNLDSAAKNNWKKLKEKIAAEKESNWRYLTWSEITGDPSLIKEAQEILDKEKTAKTGIRKELGNIDNYINAAISYVMRKFGGNIISYFITGNFRTPRQMMEYMVKNGYQKSGVGWLKLSAEASNYMQMKLFKYLYLPVIASLCIYISSLLTSAGTLTGDEISFLETFWGQLTGKDDGGLEKTIKSIGGFIWDDFSKYSPEWYKWYKEYGVSTPLSPAGKSLVYLTAIAQSDLPTEEEREEEAKTKTYNTVNEKLEKNWDNATPEQQQKARSESAYAKLRGGLSEYKYPDLTADEQKLIYNRLSFEPGITRDENFDSLIQDKENVLKDSAEKVALGQFDPKSINVKAIKGYGLIEGKSGKKYKVVPVFRNNDPYSLYGKTSDPNIKDYWAWLKPPHDEITSKDSVQPFSMKQFIEEYNTGKN